MIIIEISRNMFMTHFVVSEHVTQQIIVYYLYQLPGPISHGLFETHLNFIELNQGFNILWFRQNLLKLKLLTHIKKTNNQLNLFSVIKYFSFLVNFDQQ